MEYNSWMWSHANEALGIINHDSTGTQTIKFCTAIRKTYLLPILLAGPFNFTF